jgi:hypothetical protein
MFGWLLASFLTVLPGRAQVTFAPVQSYPVAAGFRVTTGDFNGDGKPDIAALTILGGGIDVLLNNGDGTFAAPHFYSAITPDPFGPSGFSGVIVGDVNNDRILDVIVTHCTDTSAVISVLLGKGDGTFQPPNTTSLDSLAWSLFGLGDFDADGKLDVAYLGDDPDGRSLILYLGNGDGSFHRGSTLTLALPSEAAVVADENGDGKLDVVFAPGEGTLEFIQGNGDGTFQPAVELPSQAPGIMALASGDFNHDGFPDLFSTSYTIYFCEFGVCQKHGPSGSATVQDGNGDGTFGGPGVIKGADFGFMATGDFDGDGNLDFSAGEMIEPMKYTGALAFYLGDGKGTFASPNRVTFAIASDMAADDFDGDEFTDLVLLSDSTLQVALNTTQTFSLAISESGPPIHAGSSATYTLEVGRQHNFSGDVALTCQTPDPTIQCSFSQGSVKPGETSTLTVTTTAKSAAQVRRPHQALFYGLLLPIGGIICSGFRFRYIDKQGAALLALTGVLFFGMVFQTGCGGAEPPRDGGAGTPAGTYTITVTGSSGVTQRSATVKLTVQ